VKISDKFQIFKKKMFRASEYRERIQGMKTELKMNLKNPENHPKYEEEWRKFYVERTRNLNSLKLVSLDDLIKEWINYWPRRIVDLYNEEVIDLRRGME
jgi:hypothetical protein